MPQPVNPFDEENGQFHVLQNSEQYYSLWPMKADVPAGWRIVFESGSKEACLDYVRENWTGSAPAPAKKAHD